MKSIGALAFLALLLQPSSASGMARRSTGARPAASRSRRPSSAGLYNTIEQGGTVTYNLQQPMKLKEKIEKNKSSRRNSKRDFLTCTIKRGMKGTVRTVKNDKVLVNWPSQGNSTLCNIWYSVDEIRNAFIYAPCWTHKYNVGERIFSITNIGTRSSDVIRKGTIGTVHKIFPFGDDKTPDPFLDIFWDHDVVNRIRLFADKEEWIARFDGADEWPVHIYRPGRKVKFLEPIPMQKTKAKPGAIGKVDSIWKHGRNFKIKVQWSKPYALNDTYDIKGKESGIKKYIVPLERLATDGLYEDDNEINLLQPDMKAELEKLKEMNANTKYSYDKQVPVTTWKFEEREGTSQKRRKSVPSENRRRLQSIAERLDFAQRNFYV